MCCCTCDSLACQKSTVSAWVPVIQHIILKIVGFYLISYEPKVDTQCLKIVPPFVMVFKPRRLKVTKPPKTMRVAEIPMRIRLIFLTVIKLVRACENFWNKEKRTEREIVNLLLFDPHICKPKCSSVIKHK